MEAETYISEAVAGSRWPCNRYHHAVSARHGHHADQRPDPLARLRRGIHSRGRACGRGEQGLTIRIFAKHEGLGCGLRSEAPFAFILQAEGH